MNEDEYKKFHDMHTEGQMVAADEPGHVMAALALTAQRQLSGEFLSWDSDELAPYRKK